MTVQIPNSQVGWFEQMILSMGWKFKKEVDQPIDVQLDNLIASFKTDQITQEEIDQECEIVREQLYNERQSN